MKKSNVSTDKICELYQEGNSQDEVAKILNISQWVVSDRLKKAGVKSRDRTLKIREYIDSTHIKPNEKFFDTLTPTSAYILGWILSDGNVKGNRITFRLSKKDEDILHTIKRCLSFNGKIREYKSYLEKTDKYYECVSLQITSKKLIENLLDYDIKENKTLSEIYPEKIKNDSEIINRRFIQGVFEGDGTITKYKSSNQIVFQLVGTKELLLDIQTVLIKYLNLRKTKLYHQRNNHYMLRYTGNKQVLKIFEWIYNDCEYYLKRKYKIYQRYKGELE